MGHASAGSLQHIEEAFRVSEQDDVTGVVSFVDSRRHLLSTPSHLACRCLSMPLRLAPVEHENTCTALQCAECANCDLCSEHVPLRHDRRPHVIVSLACTRELAKVADCCVPLMLTMRFVVPGAYSPFCEILICAPAAQPVRPPPHAGAVCWHTVSTAYIFVCVWYVCSHTRHQRPLPASSS